MEKYFEVNVHWNSPDRAVNTTMMKSSFACVSGGLGKGHIINSYFVILFYINKLWKGKESHMCLLVMLLYWKQGGPVLSCPLKIGISGLECIGVFCWFLRFIIRQIVFWLPPLLSHVTFYEDRNCVSISPCFLGFRGDSGQVFRECLWIGFDLPYG